VSHANMQSTYTPIREITFSFKSILPLPAVPDPIQSYSLKKDTKISIDNCVRKINHHEYIWISRVH
ncbi:MAG TPA: hypothetical protein PK453_13835, partial [Leptospiraceae bacterium]|nr:hypothetical protein [Leptospiraceae bacterium]